MLACSYGGLPPLSEDMKAGDTGATPFDLQVKCHRNLRRCIIPASGFVPNSRGFGTEKCASSRVNDALAEGASHAICMFAFIAGTRFTWSMNARSLGRTSRRPEW